MENTMTTAISTISTTSTTSNPCRTSDLAMPARGRHALTVGEQLIPGTGLTITGPTGTTSGTTVRDLRDRNDLAGKGQVAFAASVPGNHAWSPPLC